MVHKKKIRYYVTLVENGKPFSALLTRKEFIENLGASPKANGLMVKGKSAIAYRKVLV